MTNNASFYANEQQQRIDFIKWYENIGTKNSANTISTAINKAKLKNGKAVFAISSYGELNDVIKNGALENYFQDRDGDYAKMDDIFIIDSSCQRDDLKSGIKYYLNFLRSPSALINNFAIGFMSHLLQKGAFMLDDNDSVITVAYKHFLVKYHSEWETETDKNPYYICLYSDKALLQLFLSRILFNSDDTLSWYMDTPTNKDNQEIFNKTLQSLNLDKLTVDKIKDQQNKLYEYEYGSQKQYKAVNKVYVLAKQATITVVYAQLEKLLCDVMVRDVGTGDLNENEELEIFREGYFAEEYLVNRLYRNRKYIQQVQKRDNYTCQVCGYKMFVNGKPVIAVHHMDRLVTEVETVIARLTCLCHNCHYIAHTRRKDPYSVEEIKDLLKQG